MNAKIVFIPGGGVPPDVSEPIVKEYSKQLRVDIKLLQYPEYTLNNFKTSIKNDSNYFRKFIKETYGKNPVIIIGFSLGAYFALDLVLDENIDIESVILVSPYIKKYKNIFGLIYGRINSFIIEQKSYADFFSYSISQAIRDLIVYRKPNLEQVKNIIMKLKLTPEMLSSDTKKLIIIGDKDPVIPKYSKEELNMKNSTLIYVPGGHDILNSRNMPVVPILKDFLFQDK